MSKPDDNIADLLPYVAGACHWDEVMTAEVRLNGQSFPVKRSQALGGVAFNVSRAMASLGQMHVAHFVAGDDLWGANLRQALATHFALIDGSLCKSHSIEQISRAFDLSGSSDTKPKPLCWLEQRQGARTASYCCVQKPDGAVQLGLADMDIYDNFGFPSSLAPKTLIVDSNLPSAYFERMPKDARLHMVATSPIKIKKLAHLVPRLDSLFLNKQEAQALTSQKMEFVDLGRAVSNLGVKRVLITDGPRPCLLISEGQILYGAAPRPLEAKRSHNGLGDRLAGLTLARMLKSFSFEDAVESALAGL